MTPEAVERFRDWLNGDDPLLVLVVVDGLRADRFSKTDRRGEHLMPHLHALAEQAIEYGNCFSECPVSGTGLYCLLAGLSPFDYFRQAQTDTLPVDSGFDALVKAGFEVFAVTPSGGLSYHDGLLRLPWLWPASRAEQPSAPDRSPALLKTEFAAHADSVLGRMSTSARPTLLVVFADPLVPPYLDYDEFLTRTDPAPWTGGGTENTMETHRTRRRLVARNRGGPSPTARPVEANWLLDAAHAATDLLLGRLVDRIEQENLWRRTCLVVTSLRGMNIDGRDQFGPTGLALGQIRTPLVVRLPDGIGTPRRVDAPVVLGDLGATFAHHLGRGGTMTGSGVDLLGVLSTERDRWSLAWSDDYDKYLAADWGGTRLTTSTFTAIVGSDGTHRLFDPRLDPGEFEDLSSREPAALEQVQGIVHDEIYGSEREVWIYFKGSAGSELLTGSITASSPPDEWEALYLEDDDSVTQADSSLVVSLMVEEPGDLLRLRISGSDPGLGLAFEEHGERGFWPVFVGKAATVYDGSFLALDQHQEGLLRAIVPDPGAGIVEWARDLDGGIYLWVVPTRQ